MKLKNSNTQGLTFNVYVVEYEVSAGKNFNVLEGGIPPRVVQIERLVTRHLAFATIEKGNRLAVHYQHRIAR
jgi:hypothetical protein